MDHEPMTHTFQLSGKLRAEHFTGAVVVALEDGSCLAFTYGFAAKEGEALAIYTEHNGYWPIPIESVTTVGQGPLHPYVMDWYDTNEARLAPEPEPAAPGDETTST